MQGIKAPRVRRFMAPTPWRLPISPPEELVPERHFRGTVLRERIFAFYGEAHQLPAEIDWERNPGTAHWGHDLNRFGYLVRFSADEADEARVMLSLMLDWIGKHDRETRGPSAYAWQNLLNAAIRLENWLRFLHQYDSAGLLRLPPAQDAALRLSIWRHVRILVRWISEYGLHNNWSLIGLRAVMFALYALPALPLRDRYLDICWRLVRSALEQQILPDGVHQELSPHYHWVVAELVDSIQTMSLQCGDNRGLSVSGELERMTAFLRALMCPNGRIVSLGDSDADYGPRIGAFLARRPASERSDDPDIREFAYAGLASVRVQKTRSLLVFDAGPFGTGHQHEDKLGFWLSAHGADIVVDPGRYLYERGAETFYAYLVSPYAHSTILVDGWGQNARAAPELWRASAAAPPIVSLSNDGVALQGVYELGYGPDRIPVRHQRRILARPEGDVWIIFDRLSGEGERALEARIQFHPCEWRLDEDAFRGVVNGVAFELWFDRNTWTHARVASGETDPKAGWWSPELNRIEPAPMLILSARAGLPFESQMRLSVSLKA